MTKIPGGLFQLLHDLFLYDTDGFGLAANTDRLAY